MQENLKTKDIPERKKVLKPWGSEYTIYSNKISSTKLLKLNSNQSTSLHCHPIKKTGFILIKGTVEVDLGFYNKKELNSLSRLMIRPGLFHCTSNNENETATILEIETPIDKDDLVRYKDEYGRENKPYEGKNHMENLSKNDPIFEEPSINEVKKYVVEDVAILDGGLKSNNNLLVLSPGDIVGTDTIKKLSEVFKIDKYITFLWII